MQTCSAVHHHLYCCPCFFFFSPVECQLLNLASKSCQSKQEENICIGTLPHRLQLPPPVYKNSDLKARLIDPLCTWTPALCLVIFKDVGCQLIYRQVLRTITPHFKHFFSSDLHISKDNKRVPVYSFSPCLKL